MSIQVSESGRVTVLAPDQPLLEENLDPVRDELERCLRAAREQIVLDLGQVPFIDSRGLELLVDCARRLRVRGGRLQLANPSPICSEILSATRTDSEIEVIYDLQRAGRNLR